MHYITQDYCQSDPVILEIFVTIWSCSIGVTYNATQLTECSISLLYSFDMVICLHYAGIITLALCKTLYSVVTKLLQPYRVTHIYTLACTHAWTLGLKRSLRMFRRFEACTSSGIIKIASKLCM